MNLLAKWFATEVANQFIIINPDDWWNANQTLTFNIVDFNFKLGRQIGICNNLQFSDSNNCKKNALKMPLKLVNQEF